MSFCTTTRTSISSPRSPVSPFSASSTETRLLDARCGALVDGARALPHRRAVYRLVYSRQMAKTVAVRELRSNLSKLLSDVADRRDHVLVTRNGRPAAVLVPIDEYDALEETAEVLSDPTLDVRDGRAPRCAVRARRRARRAPPAAARCARATIAITSSSLVDEVEVAARELDVRQHDRREPSAARPRARPQTQASAANGASQMTYCGEKTLPSVTNASSAAKPHRTRWRGVGTRARRARRSPPARARAAATNSRCDGLARGRRRGRLT